MFKLKIKESEELQRAIARELDNNENKNIKGLLDESSRDKDDTESSESNSS